MLQLSWRKKLFIFFGLVALIPIGISGWNMIGISSDEFKSSTNDQLSAVAGQIANQINNNFANRWLDPLLIIKSGLEGPELGGNEKASLLTGSAKNTSDMISAALYFKQGEKNYATAIKVIKDSFLASAGKSGADASIFFLSNAELSTLDNGEITKSDPEFSSLLNVWTMNICLPVNIPGSPKGLLVAKVDMTHLQKYLENHYYNKTGKIYVISKDGKQLFDKSKTDLHSLKVVQDAIGIINSQSRVQGTTQYKNSENENVVGCYAFPENVDWAVIAEIKESIAYAPVSKIRNTLWLWVFFGLVIAMSGGALFSNDISKPIIKLSKAAEKISEGDFDIQVEHKGTDAIGVLGTTLVSMSQSLKQSFAKIAQQNKELEDYSKTLEIKVEERTIELKDKNEALENTLFKLKETQEQLIVQQKMASLGQLTAGIAHEIKNPLNFVNNFAKLSGGLVDELQEEMDRSKGSNTAPDFGYVEEILGDIHTNVTKIAEHGTRADNIVKNMLEHSRSDSGEFTEANVNKVLEEAVNLAYHGTKTQNQEFNTTLDLKFDPAIKACKINPQALSQVFINIFNNSFYAMFKKKEKAGESYDPILTVVTKDAGDKIEIKVRDNGTGIPQSILQKVFEPFFTTKPTGEGTGLGLSLSFDIINQMHRGEMSVDSKDGEFSEFVIKIPKNLNV